MRRVRALTDVDADGVYDIVVALEPGTYEYKFTLDGWTTQEEFTDGDACTTTIDGFVNRTVTVTECHVARGVLQQLRRVRWDFHRR